MLPPHLSSTFFLVGWGHGEWDIRSHAVLASTKNRVAADFSRGLPVVLMMAFLAASDDTIMDGSRMGYRYGMLAPASNHCLITRRSASVMPVALFMGMIFVTTTCW
jgi:hypothetical protein